MFEWLKKFIERLGESNKKEFGEGKLDCCDLNTNDKDNQHKHNHNNSSKDK